MRSTSEAGERKRPLEDYRAKRSASATGEPFSGGASASGRLFVVQKHRASSLHWDLRLEMDGVLVSWAVPKGPSPNQSDKRLAVHVEDHPLEYADFEGVVPPGNYGAGPSILWDRGSWQPVGDPAEGMAAGKLLFDLHGYKLRGRWTLVRTKGGADNHWLLIKERDAYEDPSGGTEGYPDDSILSGLTVEQLGEGGDVGAALRARCRSLGAEAAEVDGGGLALMLAESSAEPFSREGWVFEIKYDGYRALADGGRAAARLFSRNGNDLTRTFPEVARAVRGLPYRGFLLDGEVVVTGESGVPSFRLIQKRGRLRRESDVARAAAERPATYFAFDLLAFEGFDLRPLPLLARKEILREALPSVGPVRYSEHIAGAGEAVFANVVAMGLEGVVGKRAESPYVGGRSRSWVKVRALRTDDFVVHGFTEPEVGDGFGALHLAQYDDRGEAVYRGRVGSGFSARALRELSAALRGLEPSPPPKQAEAGPGRHRWVAPALVAEVRYQEVTEAGHLRQPIFLRLRDDKPPRECTVQEAGRALPEPVRVERSESKKVVHFSNLEKILWPEDGYAKQDLVDYYRSAAPWILPHLSSRPVVLTRYPDGIHGKSFFQKHAPEFAPAWMRRTRIYSEGAEREVDYFVAEDVESLLYIANSASIPLHVWLSRVPDVAHPDYCVLDLDPKEAPFAHVVEIAVLLKRLADEIALPAFVKTSGSTGLHVAFPLGGLATYQQSRALGELLALAVVRELGEVATVARRPSQREGKVYVDFVQNGHGRLIAAPYCVRPLPGAPVSAPLDWAEVKAGLSLRDYTIKTVPARMAALGRDPFAGALDMEPDLRGSLGRLRSVLGI